MARDPARIDRVLRDLGSFWKAHPDLRLGQLLLNAVDPDDLYQVEDLSLVRKVMKFYSDADLQRGRPPLISKDDEEEDDPYDEDEDEEEKPMPPPGKDLVSQEVTERKIAEGATVGPGGPAQTHVMGEGGIRGASGASGAMWTGSGPHGIQGVTGPQWPRPMSPTPNEERARIELARALANSDSEDEDEDKDE